MLIGISVNNGNENFNFFIFNEIAHEASQRFALPALGRGRRSRPARKMIRRRKLLEICAESPASGARFVRQPARLPERLLKKDTAANTPNFYTQLNFWQ